MESSLLVFPLPILTFLLSGLVCLMSIRLDLGTSLARNLLVLFFALIAVESLLVALRFGYGIAGLIPIQRTLPLFGGPILYLTFAVLSGPRRHGLLIAIHLATAVIAAVTVPLFSGDWINMDWVISLSYLVYATALLAMWRKGANYLSRARLEIVEKLRHWMLWGAGFLVVVLFVDTAIAVNFMLQKVDSALAVISYASVLFVPALILILISISGQKAVLQINTALPTPVDDDAKILVQSTHDLLIKTQLYVDTNLTVERLAKRLHVPVRAISTAINRCEGVNVSQYVNQFRLQHAAQLLTSTGKSIKTIMEESGFLTRSNFYREFQKYYNQTPSTYRQQHLNDVGECLSSANIGTASVILKHGKVMINGGLK